MKLKRDQIKLKDVCNVLYGGDTKFIWWLDEAARRSN